MFDWTHALVLALIQGLSEFLPISSSAHLVLPSLLLGWQDQGLLFDVAVHMGTLIAVASYFWRDLLALAADLFPALGKASGRSEGELWRLVVATVPAVLAGILLSSFIEDYARTLPVIAATTLVFGLLLGVASWRNTRVYAAHADRNVIQTVHWRHALLIGFAQVFALIPGTSRSGVTMTAGLLLGYSPATAARFSFLMSVPIILGAVLFMALEAVGEPSLDAPLDMMFCATLVSGLSAYATIALFLGVVTRVGMMPFVWYRLGLGSVLLLIILL